MNSHNGEYCPDINLSIEEETDIIIDEEALLDELKKGENSLIGKLQTERYISKDVLRNTMVKAWKTTSFFLVKEIQTNNFIFSFDSHTNMLLALHRKYGFLIIIFSH